MSDFQPALFDERMTQIMLHTSACRGVHHCAPAPVAECFLQPAAIYAAPVSVVVYVFPASAVHGAPAPVVENISPGAVSIFWRHPAWAPSG